MLRSRTVSMIAGVAAAAVVLAACGSSSTTSNSGSTTSESATSSSSAAATSTTAMSGSGATGSTAEQSSATGDSGSGSAAPASPSSDTAGSSAAPGSSSDTAGSSAAPSSNSDTAGSSSAPGSSTAPAPAEQFPKLAGDPSKVSLGMAYDGPKGDQSFTDSAARGVAAAAGQGVKVVAELSATVGEPAQKKVDRLSQLIDQGANTVIAVGFDYAESMGTVAADNPDVHFAIVDDASLSDPKRKGGALANVASLTFAAEQSSFLVGVAAALKSKKGHVGFIGGVNVPLLQTFQAGFDAGAKAAKPDITIDDKYITQPPDFSGFNAPDKGKTIGQGMYSGGADVIYAAAGGSGNGVFKAAKAAKTLAIGVDSDQYNLAVEKDVILTSAVKNVDVAVYDMIASVASGKALTGVQTYDLKNNGVGYVTSGGFVDDIKSKLEDYRAKIISGAIKVPSTLG